MIQHGGDIYTHKNCIDFSANINPLGMPKAVADAAKEAVDAAVHYPDVLCRELKEAVARMEQVKPEQLFFGNGAADVLFLLVQALRPKQALVLAPSFLEYENALAAVGCATKTYTLKEENGFCLQEDFLEAITPDVQMVFLCNPNNPTGVLSQRSFLERVLHRCEQAQALLVVDECFLALCEQPRDYSLVPMIEKSSWLFVLKAFTKTFAMPGLRLGYGLCGQTALIEKMEQISQPWRVSVPAQAAGVAAVQVEEEENFLLKSRQFVAGLRTQLAKELTALGYRVYDAKANYLFFYDTFTEATDSINHASSWANDEADDAQKQTERTAMQLKNDLGAYLLQEGCLIRDCANYPGLKKGYYRIAVRTPKENQVLLDALQKRRIT